jgi:hypothetical protein
MTLSVAEKTFFDRMVPHMIDGKSMEDAARAVLADDERLWLVATAKDDVGEAIRSELCTQVYNGLRRAA